MLRDSQQIESVGQWVGANMGQLQRIVPEGRKAQLIVQSVMMAIRKNDKLAESDPASIIWSAIEAAHVGFPVNTNQQLAFLVPYKGECTFQLGWRGLADLAMQSPAIKSVYTRPVYESDQYEVLYGTDDRIVHVPGNNDRTNDDQIIAVYAVIKYTNGGHDFEPMTRAQVEKIRKSSPGQNSPAWRDHWGEMARKCAMKRLLKRVPTHPVLDDAIDRDHRRQQGERVTMEGAIPASAFDVPPPREITDGPSPMSPADDADEIPMGAGGVRGGDA